ncbi:MAG: flagellar protein FlaG [Defluviitaleaceae bacterium]|nr:flagellar protein FlaG [Defluviitaleaceae bacterium]MCL2239908.1 flagellar protein FlaG [Defluviitaleaceae bacterium]
MDVNRVATATPLPPPPTPSAPVATEATPLVAAPVNGAAIPAPAQNGGSADASFQERGDVTRLEVAVRGLNQSLAPHQRHMSIDTHEATGRIMVAVYDTDTREIIREIPPQRVLDAHASLLEMAGLFMDRRG